MFIKIAVLGKPTVEDTAAEGARISDVLRKAGVAYNAADQVMINGAATNFNAQIRDNGTNMAVIAITPAVKGGAGQFLLKVALSGGQTHEVLVNEGWSVADAIKAAGFDAAGKTITVNGNVATLGQRLYGGENLIVLSPTVKGGR